MAEINWSNYEVVDAPQQPEDNQVDWGNYEAVDTPEAAPQEEPSFWDKAGQAVAKSAELVYGLSPQGAAQSIVRGFRESDPAALERLNQLEAAVAGGAQLPPFTPDAYAGLNVQDQERLMAMYQADPRFQEAGASKYLTGVVGDIEGQAVRSPYLINNPGGRALVDIPQHMAEGIQNAAETAAAGFDVTAGAFGFDTNQLDVAKEGKVSLEAGDSLVETAVAEGAKAAPLAGAGSAALGVARSGLGKIAQWVLVDGLLGAATTDADEEAWYGDKALELIGIDSVPEDPEAKALLVAKAGLAFDYMTLGVGGEAGLNAFKGMYKVLKERIGKPIARTMSQDAAEAMLRRDFARDITKTIDEAPERLQPRLMKLMSDAAADLPEGGDSFAAIFSNLDAVKGLPENADLVREITRAQDHILNMRNAIENKASTFSKYKEAALEHGGGSSKFAKLKAEDYAEVDAAEQLQGSAVRAREAASVKGQQAVAKAEGDVTAIDKQFVEDIKGSGEYGERIGKMAEGELDNDLALKRDKLELTDKTVGTIQEARAAKNEAYQIELEGIADAEPSETVSEMWDAVNKRVGGRLGKIPGSYGQLQSSQKGGGLKKIDEAISAAGEGDTRDQLMQLKAYIKREEAQELGADFTLADENFDKNYRPLFKGNPNTPPGAVRAAEEGSAGVRKDILTEDSQATDELRQFVEEATVEPVAKGKVYATNSLERVFEHTGDKEGLALVKSVRMGEAAQSISDKIVREGIENFNPEKMADTLLTNLNKYRSTLPRQQRKQIEALFPRIRAARDNRKELVEILNEVKKTSDDALKEIDEKILNNFLGKAGESRAGTGYDNAVDLLNRGPQPVREALRTMKENLSEQEYGMASAALKRTWWDNAKEQISINVSKGVDVQSVKRSETFMKSDAWKVAGEIFDKEEQEAISTFVDMMHRINTVEGASASIKNRLVPDALEAITSRNLQDSIKAANLLITATFGVLNPAATKARNIAGMVLRTIDKKDANVALLDTLMADPKELKKVLDSFQKTFKRDQSAKAVRTMLKGPIRNAVVRAYDLNGGQDWDAAVERIVAQYEQAQMERDNTTTIEKTPKQK